MAKNNELFIVALGLGALYLLSRTNLVAGTYPVTTTGTGILPSTSAPGSLVSALSNLFHPGTVAVQNPNGTTSYVPVATGGATDVTNINQIAAQGGPATETNYSGGCVSNGNVCDPNDCSYDPAVCAEMSPQ